MAVQLANQQGAAALELRTLVSVCQGSGSGVDGQVHARRLEQLYGEFTEKHEATGLTSAAAALGVRNASQLR